MSMFSIFNISGSALHANSVRLNVTASNLANAESASSSTSQTYRARSPVFATLMEEGFDHSSAGVEVTGIIESQAPLRREYQPGHPLADQEGYINLPNVNPVEEMANMIAASRAYQSNLEVINTSKTLLTRTLSLGQ
ncbi:MAG: flagellar basal body rod protein FlgC [Candidatus Competibacteraceae bacterium]|nr:flagellar basal body rod protein FlgC [Candidatus Competibacteraceae bacterium]